MKKIQIAVSALAVTLALSTAALCAGHFTVIQKDKAFSQAELTVHVGDTISFENQDGVAHNVYSKTAGHEFNTKSQPPGTSKEVSFDSPGDVEVRCAIHPNMKLKIHVQN